MAKAAKKRSLLPENNPAASQINYRLGDRLSVTHRRRVSTSHTRNGSFMSHKSEERSQFTHHTHVISERGANINEKMVCIYTRVLWSMAVVYSIVVFH